MCDILGFGITKFEQKKDIAMKIYTRFTEIERKITFVLLQQNLAQKEIAFILNRHPSTICREIKRCNLDSLGYYAVLAHQKALKLQKRYFGKIITNEMKYFIISSLEMGHSPEQIAGRMKLLDMANAISHETIYQYIYSKEGQDLRLPLLLNKKRIKRRNRYSRKPRKRYIEDSTHISNRPKFIDNRKKLGHWEGDLLISTSKKSSNITTLLERKSRACILVLNKNKCTDTVISGIQNAFAKLPKKLAKTITFDRGTEFASYRNLDIDTYFCNPHSPWEKGSNENFNGRLRSYFPKNYDHKNLTQKKLDLVASIMNNTPRKCLGYKTPNEVISPKHR